MADPKIRIRATDETGPAFRTASSNLDGLAGSAAKLVGALAGTLAVSGLASLVRGAIDAADELSKLSQRTGIAVETLGGLGFAADLAGISMEGITDAADKLNKSLAEAASGQKLASEAFSVLGISATDAAGQTKSVDVAMAEIADKFASFADGPEKAALAMRLFGKVGADQIVLLNGGGAALREQIEYYKRYAGVTAETASRAEVFNDTLSKIGLLSTSLGNTLATSLLPSLQAVADAMLALKENGAGFSSIGDALRVVFETLAITGANVSFVLVSIGREIGAVAAQAVALARLDIKGFNAISVAVKEDGRIARAELDALERRIRGLGASSPTDESAAERRRLGLSGPSTTKRAAPRLPSSGAGAAPKADPISDAERALARYVDQLANVIEKTQSLTEQEKALNFLREIGTTGQIPQVRELVLGLAAQIDAEKTLKAATEERIALGRQASIDAADRVAEENRAYQDKLKTLTEGAASNVFKRQQEDLDLLKEALDRADISVQVYTESVQNLFNLNQQMEKTKSIGEELGLTFTSAFEDAIVGGKKFSDVLKGLEQDILRIVTRKLVTEPLGGAITDIFKSGGSGGGIGGALSGLFSKLFSFDGGGYTGGGSRAGGMDGRGGFLAMMHPNETVIDHARGQGVGRNVVVNINQSFAQGTSRATTMQAAADARRQLEYAGRNL